MRLRSVFHQLQAGDVSSLGRGGLEIAMWLRVSRDWRIKRNEMDGRMWWKGRSWLWKAYSLIFFYCGIKHWHITRIHMHIHFIVFIGHYKCQHITPTYWSINFIAVNQFLQITENIACILNYTNSSWKKIQPHIFLMLTNIFVQTEI